MISNFDVIQHFKNKDRKAFGLVLDEDNETLVDENTHERVCSIETLTGYLRRKAHCDFETVYYEHASLDCVYHCRECGTVIFGGDDERYDPNCRCPTCCNDKSVCQNEFWTADEIGASEEKKEHIKALEQAQKAFNEAAARRKARGGLYDWQRWVKEFRLKNHHITVSYINFGWGVEGWKKDKYIEIMDYEYEKSNKSYVWGGGKGHCIKIPLSFYDIYIRWIYPYSKKCHPDFRKYHFWQRKPELIN